MVREEPATGMAGGVGVEAEVTKKKELCQEIFTDKLFLKVG